MEEEIYRKAISPMDRTDFMSNFIMVVKKAVFDCSSLAKRLAFILCQDAQYTYLALFLHTKDCNILTFGTYASSQCRYVLGQKQ